MKLARFAENRALLDAARAKAVVSDSDGAFLFDGIMAGQWSLEVACSGWELMQTEPVATGTLDSELVLTRAAPVDGVVVDGTTGEPVSGVVGYLRGTGDREGYSDLRFETDAKGKFTVATAWPGDYEVALQRGAYWLPSASIDLGVDSHGNQGLRLLVYPTGAVSGRVVDAATGEGLAGVRVRAEGIADGSVGVPFQWERGPWVYATTDLDGRFWLDRLIPGRHRLTYSYTQAMPFPTWEVHDSRPEFVVPQSGGTAEVTWIVPRTQRVDGIVIDDVGRPVAGAFVEALSDTVLDDGVTAGADEFHPMTQTNTSGRFAIYFAGAYSDIALQARAPGWASRVMQGVATSPVEGEPITLQMGRSGSMAIRVDAGEPLGATFTVEAQHSGQWRRADAIAIYELDEARAGLSPRNPLNQEMRYDTNWSGSDFGGIGYRHFYIGSLPADTYTIRYEDKIESVPLAAGEAVDGIVLSGDYSGLAEWVGQVTFQGEPLANATVGGSSSWTLSDEQGRFRVRGETPKDGGAGGARYVLFLGGSTATYLLHSRNETLVFEADGRLELDLPMATGPNRLAIRVRIDGESAVVTCETELPRNDAFRERVSATSNRNGEIWIPGVADGDCYLRFRVESTGLVWTEEVAVSGGGDMPVDIDLETGRLLLVGEPVPDGFVGQLLVYEGEPQLEAFTVQNYERQIAAALLDLEWRGRQPCSLPVPVGRYTVVWGVYDDRPKDVADSFATLRQDVRVVDVAAGRETEVGLAPR